MPVTVAVEPLGPLSAAPLLTRHSTSRTPEPESAPVTSTE